MIRYLKKNGSLKNQRFVLKKERIVHKRMICLKKNDSFVFRSKKSDPFVKKLPFLFHVHKRTVSSFKKNKSFINERSVLKKERIVYKEQFVL